MDFSVERKRLGWASPLDFGAVAATLVPDATVLAGGTAVSSPGGHFTSAMDGQFFWLRRGGAQLVGANATQLSIVGDDGSWEASPLFGTFAYISPTAGTLSVAATTAVAAGSMIVGPDATTAINNALHTGECRLPSSIPFIVAGQILYTADGQVLRGESGRAQLFAVTDKLNGPVAAFFKNVVAADFAWWGTGRGLQPANTTPADGDYAALAAALVGAGCGVTFAAVKRGLMDVHAYHCGGHGIGANTNGIAGLYSTMGCQDSTFRGRAMWCRNGLNEDAYFGSADAEKYAPRMNAYENIRTLYCRFGQALESGSLSRGAVVDHGLAAFCMLWGFDVHDSTFVTLVHPRAIGNGYYGTPDLGPGIDVYGTSDGTITCLYTKIIEPFAYGNGGHGIRFRDYAQRSRVEGGTVTRNGRIGVFANNHSDYTEIDGPTLRLNNQTLDHYDAVRLTDSSRCRVYVKQDEPGSPQHEYAIQESGASDYNTIDDRSDLVVGSLGTVKLVGANTSAGSTAKRRKVGLTARGLKGESYALAGRLNAIAFGAGNARGALVDLLAGDLLANLYLDVTVAGSGLTLAKMCVWKADGTLLGSSADVKSQFTSGTGLKGGAVGYTVPTDGSYFLGAAMVGGTPPTIHAESGGSASALSPPPAIANSSVTDAANVSVNSSSSVLWVAWA